MAEESQTCEGELSADARDPAGGTETGGLQNAGTDEVTRSCAFVAGRQLLIPDTLI